MKKALISTALTIMLFLLISACSSEQHQSEDNDSASEQTEQQKAPNFEVTIIEGDTYSLQKSMDEDKPMVIYFTAS